MRDLDRLRDSLARQFVKPYIERVAPERRPNGSAPVQLLAAGFPIRPTATGN